MRSWRRPSLRRYNIRTNMSGSSFKSKLQWKCWSYFSSGDDEPPGHKQPFKGGVSTQWQLLSRSRSMSWFNAINALYMIKMIFVYISCCWWKFFIEGENDRRPSLNFLKGSFLRRANFLLTFWKGVFLRWAILICFQLTFTFNKSKALGTNTQGFYYSVSKNLHVKRRHSNFTWHTHKILIYFLSYISITN